MRAQGGIQGGTQLCSGRRRGRGKGAYDEPGAGREAAEASCDQVPELTADPVADNGPTDGAGDDEAGTRGGEFAGHGRIGAHREVHDQEAGPAAGTAPGAAATCAQRCCKVGAAP